MALHTIYIAGTPGLHYVEDSRLYEAVYIMLFMREGKPLVETTGTPTGRQFRHSRSEGRIYVDESMPINISVEVVNTGAGEILMNVPETFICEYKS